MTENNFWHNIKIIKQKTKLTITENLVAKFDGKFQQEISICNFG